LIIKPSFKPAAVILAGGESSRLGPGTKALIALDGQPMVQHVVDRLEAQSSPLLISTQDEDSGMESLGLETVPDAIQRHRGPLTGLYSAMHHVFGSNRQDWLLLVPCDAPFVPMDLASRLYAEAGKTDKPVSVACYEEVPQPTFSLWHRSVFRQVKEVVMNEGKGGLMYMLDRLPWCGVDWAPSRVPPFFNVNTRADLQMAQSLLEQSH
jgi:molybdopterin-guanine dinucleotide biosynthesis protein A